MGKGQTLFNFRGRSQGQDVGGEGLGAWPAEDFFTQGEEYVRKIESEDSGAADQERADYKMSEESTPVAEQMTTPPLMGKVIQIPRDPNLNPEEDLKQRFGTNIKSALGAGSVIEGKLSFDSPVRIDGTLKGEVSSTSALIVGPEAMVTARLEVGSLVVLGHVTGQVVAEELVEIKSGGVLEADIATGKLVIEGGAQFNGACQMHK